MAYSGYGGYAYRNDQRVPERSDVCFTPEGLKSTCGMWPGFTFKEGRNGGSYHVILGDGPVFVCLYKQSSVSVFIGDKEVDMTKLAKERYEAKAVVQYARMSEKEYLDIDYFRDIMDAVFEIVGHTVEIYWTHDDNYYVYARLTQPDGVVWTGFSGYGVGAGLEDCGYGFSTEDREQRLQAHWRDHE